MRRLTNQWKASRAGGGSCTVSSW